MTTDLRRIGCALLIDTSGRFLLQRRDDIPGIVQPGKIGLFGGHCETGETGLECALREIGEETGVKYSADRFELLRTYEGIDTEMPAGELKATLFVVRHVNVDALRITEGSLCIIDHLQVRIFRRHMTPVGVMAFAAYFARNPSGGIDASFGDPLSNVSRRF